MVVYVLKGVINTGTPPQGVAALSGAVMIVFSIVNIVVIHGFWTRAQLDDAR